MGDKVINWIVAKMPELVEWVGGMSEGGVALLGFGLALGFVLVWEGLRYAAAGRRIISDPTNRWYEDTEVYEDWMDAEIWAAGK